MSKVIDHGTRRQFIKDYKLPIQIVKDEYFDYFLDLYQKQYQARDKYNLLIKTIDDIGSLQGFLEESRNVRQNAIDFIANRESYKKLTMDSLTEYINTTMSNKTKLYSHDHTGKTFVSIDMVKGNLQSFNYYDKEILDNSETYDEFISKFTNIPYLKESKQIRQVIFGSLMPKKQKTIQLFIMGKVKDALISAGLEDKYILASSPDEIVFEKKHFEDYKLVLESEAIKDLQLHVEVFDLESIQEDLDVFIKRFKNKDGFEIKRGNMKYMPEIIRFLNKEDLQENDLAFFDEGRIAHYNEPILNHFKKPKNKTMRIRVTNEDGSKKIVKLFEVYYETEPSRFSSLNFSNGQYTDFNNLEIDNKPIHIESDFFVYKEDIDLIKDIYSKLDVKLVEHEYVLIKNWFHFKAGTKIKDIHSFIENLK